MNVIKPELGGHKYSLDDFIFIQDSNVEQFKNLVKSLTGGSPDETIKLYGCEVTKVGDNYTHTAGAFYYNGEAYTVDALLAPLVDTGTPKWAIIESYPANNPILYKDGHPVNVHAIRKIKLVLSTELGEMAYNHASIKKLSDILKADNKANKIQEDWKYFGEEPGANFGTGFSNYSSGAGFKARFKKDEMGVVHIVAHLKFVGPGLNIGVPALTLPPGYRTSVVTYLPICFIRDSTSGYTCPVVAGSNIVLEGSTITGNVSNLYLHLTYVAQA